MTRCVSCHRPVNIAENRLVTLGWSEIMGGYNTVDAMCEIALRE